MSDSTFLDPRTETDEILRAAAARPRPPGGDYAGSVTPVEAHLLRTRGVAKIVDVRTEEELEYVGRVPRAAHVPWRLRGASAPDPDFADKLRAVVSPDDVVLLLCRSAQRSHWAAIAATAAGFRSVYNVLEGFEGDLDDDGHRGKLGGWRYHGLPWAQG